VCDFLEERCGELPDAEKTLRNFIGDLIETNQLELKENAGVYMKVPELPLGKQLQLDFGEYRTPSGLGFLHLRGGTLGKPLQMLGVSGETLHDDRSHRARA
jgi:hypothetical protein